MAEPLFKFGGQQQSTLQAPKIKRLPQYEKPGALDGIKGALGGVLSGSVDLFTGALQLLDTPRAAVTSTAKEILDIGDPDENFSLNEWWDQTADGIRFAEIAPGLKRDWDGGWVNDATQVGKVIAEFGGEVLADPLTYLGFPGAAAAARATSSTRLARTLATDMLPGTHTPTAALRHVAGQGDIGAQSYLNKLQKAPGDEDIGKEAVAYLQDAAPGQIEQVERAIVTLAERGGGAAAIKLDSLVDTLVGAKSSGVRLRPFWRGGGGPQIMSQAKWEELSRPLRGARKAVAESRPGQWMSKNIGLEAFSAAKRMVNQIPASETAMRMGMLRFVEMGDQGVRQLGAQKAKQAEIIQAFRQSLRADKVQAQAARDIMGSSLWTPDGLRSTATITDPDHRARLEAAINTLGGGDAAFAVTQIPAQFFNSMHDLAADYGIRFPKVNPYFPYGFTAKNIDPTHATELPSTVFGKEIPYVTELLRDKKITIEDGGRFTQPSDGFDRTRYRNEFDEAGQEALGENWEQYLEDDPFKVMEGYLNVMFKMFEERMLFNTAEAAGVAVQVDAWNVLRSTNKVLKDLPTIDPKLVEEASRIMARATEIKKSTDVAVAANDLLWDVGEHAYLQELAGTNMPATRQKALGDLYKTEYYHHLAPDKFKSAFAGEDDIGWLFDSAGRSLSPDPQFHVGRATRAAHQRADEVLSASKKKEAIRFKQKPLAEHLKYAAEKLSSKNMASSALAILSKDRDASYRAILGAIRRVEAEIARVGTPDNDLVQTLEALRSARDSTAEMIEETSTTEIMSPFRMADPLPEKGFAVKVPETVLTLPASMNGTQKRKMMGQWRDDMAPRLETGDRWISITGKTNPGRPDERIQKPLWPRGSGPIPEQQAKKIQGMLPENAEIPLGLTSVPKTPARANPDLTPPPQDDWLSIYQAEPGYDVDVIWDDPQGLAYDPVLDSTPDIDPVPANEMVQLFDVAPATNFEGAARLVQATGRYPGFDATRQVVKPSEVDIAADLFQIKTSDSTGWTGALEGIGQWDAVAADTGAVIRMRDGSLYVVDGHQRMNLWRRLEAEGTDPPDAWDAIVLNESDGWTPELAKYWAAETNILHNSVDALDIATVARQYSDEEMADLLNRARANAKTVAQDGAKLGALNDEALELVRQYSLLVEPMNSRYARLVPGLIPDPDDHAQAVSVLFKQFEAGYLKTMADADATVQEIAASMRGPGIASDIQQDSLFGTMGRDVFDSEKFDLGAKMQKKLNTMIKNRDETAALAINRQVYMESLGETGVDVAAARAAREELKSKSSQVAWLGMYSEQAGALKRGIQDAWRKNVDAFPDQQTELTNIAIGLYTDFIYEQSDLLMELDDLVRAASRGGSGAEEASAKAHAMQAEFLAAQERVVAKMKPTLTDTSHVAQRLPTGLAEPVAVGTALKAFGRVGQNINTRMQGMMVIDTLEAAAMSMDAVDQTLATAAGKRAVREPRPTDVRSLQLDKDQRSYLKNTMLDAGMSGWMNKHGQLRWAPDQADALAFDLEVVATDLYQEGQTVPSRAVRNLANEVSPDWLTKTKEYAQTAATTYVDSLERVVSPGKNLFPDASKRLKNATNPEEVGDQFVNVLPENVPVGAGIVVDLGWPDEGLEPVAGIVKEVKTWKKAGSPVDIILESGQELRDIPPLMQVLVTSEGGVPLATVTEQLSVNARAARQVYGSVNEAKDLIKKMGRATTATEQLDLEAAADLFFTPSGAGEYSGLDALDQAASQLKRTTKDLNTLILQRATREAKAAASAAEGKKLALSKEGKRGLWLSEMPDNSPEYDTWLEQVQAEADAIAELNKWQEEFPVLPDAVDKNVDKLEAEMRDRAVTASDEATIESALDEAELPADTELVGDEAVPTKETKTEQPLPAEPVETVVPDKQPEVTADPPTDINTDPAVEPQPSLFDEAPPVEPAREVVVYETKPAPKPTLGAIRGTAKSTPTPPAAATPPPAAAGEQPPLIPTPPEQAGPPPSAGEPPSMDGELSVVRVLPTEQAARQYAKEVGAPSIIDLEEGLEMVLGPASKGWQPPVGTPEGAASSRVWNDRMLRLEAAQAAQQAAELARPNMAQLPSAQTVENTVDLIAAAHDSGQWEAYGQSLLAANRQLEIAEATYWTQGTLAGHRAASLISEMRQALVAQDADSIYRLPTLADDAKSAARFADTLMKAIPANRPDLAIAAEKLAHQTYEDTVAAVAKTKKAVSSLTDTGSKFHKNTVRLRKAGADSNIAEVLAEQTTELARSGASILDRIADVSASMLGTRPDLSVPMLDAATPDVLGMMAALDDGMEMLRNAISPAFNARLGQLTADGMPVGPLADLATMLRDVDDAVEAWKRGVAETAQAANRPGAPSIVQWLDDVRVNRLKAMEEGSPQNKRWQKLDEKSPVWSEMYTDDASRLAKAATEMPAVATKVDGLADDVAETVANANNDYLELVNSKQDILSRVEPDDKNTVEAIIDVVALEHADRARAAAYLKKAEKVDATMSDVQEELAKAGRFFGNDKAVDMLRSQMGFKLREYNGYMIPEELADGIKATLAFNEAGKTAQFLTKLTASWRGLAVMSPGFHVRNIIGATFNNAVAGVKAQEYAEFWQSYKKLLDKEPPTTEMDKLVHTLMGRGDIGWGRFRSEIPQVASTRGWLPAPGQRSLLPLAGSVDPSKQFVLTAFNRELGGHVEDIMRGTLALSMYKRGMAQGIGEDAALSMASNAIGRWHFHYHDISAFEAKVKNVIPFWVWTSRNLGLQLDLLAHNPQIALNANRLFETIGEDHPENPFVPGYFNKNRYTQIGQRSWMTLELPFMAAGEMVRVKFPPNKVEDLSPELIGGLNPIFKSAAELAFGRDTWRGQELTAQDQVTRQLENWAPLSKRISRWVQEANQRDGAALLSQSFSFWGIPYKRLSDDEMRRALNFEVKEIKDTEPLTEREVAAQRLERQAADSETIEDVLTSFRR